MRQSAVRLLLILVVCVSVSGCRTKTIYVDRYIVVPDTTQQVTYREWVRLLDDWEAVNGPVALPDSVAIQPQNVNHFARVYAWEVYLYLKVLSGL